MFRLSQNPSKLVVLIGTICMMLYTLNPPRCSIDWNQGGVTREESAPLFSKMFHFVERPMPQNGSGRNFRDRNGQIWHTSSKYDPVQLDWTRYTLGNGDVVGRDFLPGVLVLGINPKGEDQTSRIGASGVIRSRDPHHLA